jgi:class 3 adenylate cyclase/predicted ATPase
VAAKFCNECGQPLALRCGACGVEQPGRAKFCNECGTALAEPNQPTANSQAASSLSDLAPHSDQRERTIERTLAAGPSNLPAGERRQLTVLFCDLVGSTAIAARLDPEEWGNIAARYQRTAAEAVTRFGGHVAKYLGDGLVVYFGYPQAHDDDPERAVRAGLAIVDAVRALKNPPVSPFSKGGEESVPPFEKGGLGGISSDAATLHVRVGMHTGPVVISQGGGTEVEIFGDTPNVAARVQSVAQADTVFITGSTQRLVSGIFVVEELGAHTLKGVPEPVPLYRVLQPSGVRSRLDVVGHRFTPFVGRDLELGVLLDRWERVEERDGQSVVISGEAGVGKSRLMHTLRERLAAEPHTWLECRCTPYTQDSAFRPVIELVEQGLAFAAADAAAEKIRKLETALERSGFLVSDTVPLFAAFLSVPLTAAYAPLQLSPELQRKKTIEALVSWTLALGALQPLLLLVEDLHWCDPSSLELLGRLIEQSRTTRVMLLCTTRPEFQAPWPARANLTLMQLNRLTKRQAREMVAALSPERALPPAVVEAVVTRADGIPLYVEELGRMVLESGLLREREGRYELSGSLDDAIPTTLQDSLMARLDRLSAAKDVAQRAAVLGREFAYALLAAIAGVDEPTLGRGLAQLVEADLLFQRGEPPEATYMFKHALIQDAAYQSLLKRTRQQLHGRVVEVLEERFPERVASEPEVIARHYDQAGLAAQAITHYQRAGERATQRSANEEAIGHLRRALALVGTLPETRERHQRELGLQMAIGGPLIAARGASHPEYERTYARARELASQIGESPELPRVLVGMAAAYLNKGDLATGAEVAQEGLAAAERTRDAFDLLLAHFFVGQALCFQGHFSQALQHFEQSIRLYNPSEHGPQSYTVGNDYGVLADGHAAWCHLYCGYPDRALAGSEAAVALARRVEHPPSLAIALFFAGVVQLLRGEFDRTRERAEEVVGLCERLGFPMYLGVGRLLRGSARVESGEREGEAGIAEMQEAMVDLARIGQGLGAPASLFLLAEGLRKVGRHDDALGALALGLAQAEAQGQHYVDADLHRLRAEILLDIDGNAVDEAEALFGRSLEIARRQEAKWFELRAATSLARLWQRQGKRDAARDLLAPVYAWFTEGFDTKDLKDAKALLEALGAR